MQKIKVLFLLLPLFLFISAGEAFTQVVSDTLRADLEEIKIEATYSPISIGSAPMALSYRLRNLDDITARPGATMDELTFSMPGIVIQNRENYALGERMTIRGLGWRSPFGVRGVQVLMDDLPLTVADGQTIMNMIDPAMVQRVELLRGPSATFWGNSSGGVLYLSTVPPTDAPMLQYRGYAGSHETVKQELRFNYSENGTQLYGYATYFDTDGYRDHSAARLFRGSIGAQHQISNSGRLSFSANYTSMPKAQHPGALTDEMLEESPQAARENFVNSSAGKQFDQAMAGTSYLHDFNTGVMELSVHGTYRDLQNPLPFGYIGLERYAGGARGTYSFNNLPFELDSGFEWKIQQDDRFETDNINGERGDEISVEQTETVSNQALFLRSSVPLTSSLTFSAGIRADWIRFEGEDGLGDDLEGERDFFALNPSAGLIYRFGNSQLFANFSTSFESPTTTELVNRPEGGNGFNQNVDPERAISLETGFRGSIPAINADYDVTAYRMQVRDLLLGFQTETDGPVFFRNEGKTDHYGIETSIRFSTHPIYSLELMANVLRAVFNGGEYDGNDLPGVPTFRSGAILTLRPGSQIFTIDSRYTDRYAANSVNSSLTDSYLVTDLRWTITPISLGSNASVKPFLNVMNITNSRYASSVNIDAFGGFFFEPGIARSFNAGIQINFM
ncbi:TonB-dependent receptor domain-containing protein [Rhodohalobacter sp. SW132]|uniref:TonB-dependent receptor family protein n=1 Tax=Rhodohalobacter sp. SW132 TaxID=2293433 RepID=UPI0013140B09|nr:TonB-dependent receptor [Rhodohalobacter sp. SW132]